jgi:ABC-type branched-subunit amino acid transport system ATPase component
MRISSVEIFNYKGVERLQLGSLENEGVVMISGRNGAGKSLVLEAIVAAWSGRTSHLPASVGPWADELVVELNVHLSDDEIAVLEPLKATYIGAETPLTMSDLSARMSASRVSNTQSHEFSQATHLIRHPAVQRMHPFGVMDFMPANRVVPMTPSANVDLAMLNYDRIEQERNSMIEGFLRDRGNISLPSISTYLVTLDYYALLAKRQGLPATDEYKKLTDAFLAATGKAIREPEYDPARGSFVEVELPTAHRHQLSDLSSGEQEMLALMYFVRRLPATGGVLCLDEPEQHLHPTLQAALFEAMRDLAARAQLLVVSHSVNLIASAPISGLVQVSAPTGDGQNQGAKLADEPARSDLIGQLGITPADLLQNDFLLAVEGDTDARLLRTMFPVELGRAHIMIAKGGTGVVDAHDTLSKYDIGIPWMCLRDRDLLSQTEVDSLTKDRPNLFVWDRREIESMVLHAPLLEAVLSSNGVHGVDLSKANAYLVDAAEPLKNDVLEVQVSSELSRKFPPPPLPENGDRFDKIAIQLKAYAQVNLDRAAAVTAVTKDLREELEKRWPNEWHILVDPKLVLNRLVSETKIFRNPEHLLASLAAKVRDDSSVRPEGLEKFRLEVAGRLPGGKAPLNSPASVTSEDA